MKKIFLLSIFAILVVINSCAPVAKDHIKSLKWILGKWESKSDDGTLFEQWKKMDDSTFVGHAFAITQDNDTIFSENATLTERKGVITYSVTVNEQEKTDFIMIQNNNLCVFENEEHDYPQRIIYASQDSDTLYARIEGEVDGENTSEEFHFRREKKKPALSKNP